ncbi:MAG: ImmA/IrrE family metallo-endopeptidase, partial [Mucilaginibacter sp.]
MAGHYVKAVFITTGEIQHSGLNLLRNKNVMLIKVNAANKTDIVLYNKPRSRETIQIDQPVNDWKAHVEKLAEIRKRYENNSIGAKDCDITIENFLNSELNAKINWEQPYDHTEGLEYLSKKLISDMSIAILDKFDYCILKHGQPLPLNRFMGYLNEIYGLKFITNIPFKKNKAHLNGFYNRRKKTIHINPELESTGHFAFTIAHEIAHFFLHENLNISQDKYDRQADSRYDPI